jgi:hypothetical protein
MINHRLRGYIMNKTFIEMKLFQVKPDKLEQFEAKIEEMVFGLR